MMSHRRGALGRGQPLRNHSRGRGKSRALTHAEQQASQHQQRQAMREAMQTAGHRPPRHADGEAHLGADGVKKFAAAGVEQGIGGQECSLQQGKLRIGNRDGPLDGRDGNR